VQAMLSASLFKVLFAKTKTTLSAPKRTKKYIDFFMLNQLSLTDARAEPKKFH
jgi:hypothetical protein